MDLPVKRTNLLILRGVYPKDFSTDSIYEKASADMEKKVSEPAVVYTELPKKFTTVDAWPQFSNLKCWECDQMPTGYPKFIPKDPERDKDGNDVCDPYGHFDEWNCAVRHVTKEFPREQQSDALEMICLFESKFSGRKREKIMPSPPKTTMKAYCGKGGVTPKQYKEKIAQLNNDYDLSEYRTKHFIQSP